jgi:hypothetical protein
VTCQPDQTSCPPCSEFTCASMPPKHKYVKPPSGRPPITWNKITDNPMNNVSPSDDSVAPQSSGMSGRSNQQTAYKKVRLDSVSPQFNSVSARKEVSLNSILPQFSSGLQDQASVNDVLPQSSGVSAQSNQRIAYKKVRFDSIMPQFSGMSAHKEVSLDSIPQQFSGGLQNQENAMPQSSCMPA